MADKFETIATSEPLEGKNLDRYGVWIKNKPKVHTNLEDNSIDETFDDTSIDTLDIDSKIEDINFDDLDEISDTETEFDAFDLDIPTEEDLNTPIASPEKEIAEIDEDFEPNGSQFENLDLDEFLNDPSPENNDITDKTVESEISESDFEPVDFDMDDLLSEDSTQENAEVEPVELDLEFDKSFDEKQKTDNNSDTSFDDMLDELTGTTSSDNTEVNNDTSEIVFEDEVKEEPDVTTFNEGTIDTNDEFEEISIDNFICDDEAVSEEVSDNTVIDDTPQEEADFEEFSLDKIDSDEASVGSKLENELKASFDINVAEDEESSIDSIQNIAMESSDEIIDISLKDDMNIYEQPIVENKTSSQSNEDDIFFDDVEAVTNDLLANEPEVHSMKETEEKTNDKSTELLMQIANEISSMKSELANLKQEFSIHLHEVDKTAESSSNTIADNSIVNNTNEQSVQDIIDNASDAKEEDTGFFSDDEHDETIALTGDELNNILITADFTEEDSGDYEVPEVLNLGAIEPNSNISDESVPQLDGMVVEPGPITNTSEDSLSYLDEEISEEQANELSESVLEVDKNLDIPVLTDSDFASQNQNEIDIPIGDIDDLADEIPVMDLDVHGLEEDVAETIEETINTVAKVEVPNNIKAHTESKDTTLPVELKEEIKSVLSYMDQLLESLPEDKIEEFATSDYFNTYKKLFQELGIS